MDGQKKKIRLLFDMDGVIVDVTKPWIEEYFQRTGERIFEKDIKQFDLYKLVKRPNIFNEILLEKRFFLKPLPHLDVQEYFPKILKDERFDCFILTQCPCDSERAQFEKRMWLKKYFGDVFEQKRFISAHHKYLVAGNLLLDDNDRHLKMFRDEDRINRISVCFDHFWNQNAECDFRVHNWKEISELLEKLWVEKWNPTRTIGCNRHKDCSTAKSECCRDDCCEDCIGR